jgi:hypothetical protein
VLVIDYADGTASPLRDVREYLARGSATSFGIVSMTATDGGRHAYLEATEVFPTFPALFAGQPVDATSLLLAYTLPGDANLDFRVDIADFSALAATFNAPAGWRNGDFDYDGTAGIADFSLLATRFNQAFPASSRAPLVPEPAFATFLIAGAPPLLRRRKRRSPLPLHQRAPRVSARHRS